MDSDLNALLAQETAAADQRDASWRNIAQNLGQFRGLLVEHGFTTDGAESIARDYGNALIDLALNAEDDDE